MLATTFHILLVAAMIASYLAIARRLDERLGGAVATILWALVAIAAFEHRSVEVVNDEIVEHTLSVPEIGLFGAVMALVMLVFTFAAVAGELEPAEETRFHTR